MNESLTKNNFNSEFQKTINSKTLNSSVQFIIGGDLSIENISSMIQISNNHFGEDDFKYKDFTDTNNTVLRVCSDNKIIGFSIIRLLDQGQFNNEFKKVASLDFFKNSNIPFIGLIEPVVITKEFQKKGIGRKLLNIATNELAKKEASLVFLLGWKNKLGTNIEQVAKINDFHSIGELKDYWSIGYNCVICGKPPCKCSALVFVKRLKSFNEISTNL